MSVKILAVWVGVLSVVLGILGLVYPDRVMGLLGLAAASEASRSAVLGEIRAVYGGLFLVLGLWNLYAAWKLEEAREILALLGTGWLGLAGGRLLGAFVEGNPGIASWAFLTLETVCGAVLLGAAWFGEAAGEPWAPGVTDQPGASSGTSTESGTVA